MKIKKNKRLIEIFRLAFTFTSDKIKKIEIKFA